MILFIARQIPHPPDSGLRIRQQHLLRAFASVAEVQLLFSYTNESELEGVSALEPICSSIHAVEMDWRGKAVAPGPAQWRHDLMRAGELRSFRRHLFFSDAMRRAVEKLSARCRLIHVDNLHLAPCVQGMLERRQRRHRLVLDLDDIETLVSRRALGLAQPAAFPAQLVDLALLAGEQRRALRAFDRVLAASEHDRRRLGGRRNVHVVPNGVDVRNRPLADDSDGQTILCLATYGWSPNVDGLRFFLRDVLPLIRRAMPTVRTLVVGRDIPAEVQALEDGAGLRVHPDVASVEPFYRQATISVVPLRVAGGTRLRILESFAMGRPVVSTTVGCEGLEASHGDELLIADRPRELARSCLALLADRELRSRLTARAWSLAQRSSWQQSRLRLAALAVDLLSETPSTMAATSSEARAESP